jgi:hypothetical protein
MSERNRASIGGCVDLGWSGNDSCLANRGQRTRPTHQGSEGYTYWKRKAEPAESDHKNDKYDVRHVAPPTDEPSACDSG